MSCNNNAKNVIGNCANFLNWCSDITTNPMIIKNVNNDVRYIGNLTIIVNALGNTPSTYLNLIKNIEEPLQGNLKGHNTGVYQTSVLSKRTEAYVKLSQNMGLVVNLNNVYYLAPTGRVLFSLGVNRGRTLSALTKEESLLYAYLILKKDLDITLPILWRILKNPGINNNDLQAFYYQDLIEHLKKRIKACHGTQVEPLHDYYLKVQEQKQRASQNITHIIGPRLKWFSDIGFLDATFLKKHQCYPTDMTISLFEEIHQEINRGVTGNLFMSKLWTVMARHLNKNELQCFWCNLSDFEKHEKVAPLLKEAFEIFKRQFLPIAPLLQVLLYVTVKIIVENKVGVTPNDIVQWLLQSQTIDGCVYLVRFTANKDNSYMVRHSCA